MSITIYKDKTQKPPLIVGAAVSCDECGQVWVMPLAVETRADVAKIARQAGWKLREGRWFCYPHRRKIDV